MNTHFAHVVLGEGLHLRPAAQLVKLSHRFGADLRLRAGGRAADARSIFELLLLGAGPGTTLEIEATGDDAPAALEATVGLFTARIPSDPSGVVPALLPGPAAPATAEAAGVAA